MLQLLTRLPERVLSWLPGLVVVLAALLLGIGALTIVAPLSSQPAAYLAIRNVGLATVLLVLLAIGWTRCLAAVLSTSALIHFVDAMADVYFQNWVAAAGSVVVASISTVAAVWLFKHSVKMDHESGEPQLRNTG